MFFLLFKSLQQVYHSLPHQRIHQDNRTSNFCNIANVPKHENGSKSPVFHQAKDCRPSVSQREESPQKVITRPSALPVSQFSLLYRHHPSCALHRKIPRPPLNIAELRSSVRLHNARSDVNDSTRRVALLLIVPHAQTEL